MGTLPIIHKNVWRWGRKDTIVIKDGRGLCTVSVEDKTPDVAHLSDVSVCKVWRNMGIGNTLLELAKKHAIEMGAKMLCLWVDPKGWMIEWYKRHGFSQYRVYKDGMVGLKLDLSR